METPRLYRSSHPGHFLLKSILSLASEHPNMALLPVFLLFASLSSGPIAGTEVTECELTTGRTLTVIKSAGFPARYGSNVDCRYTVRRRSRSVCSVTFLFNVMDLEQSSNCTKDFLLLDSEKMCGSKPIGFSSECFLFQSL